MRLGSLLLSTLCVLFGLGQARAQGVPEPYVRLARGEDGDDAALQTGVAHFRAPGRDVEIVLYGVVHVAEAEFFAQVQRELDSYTTVLFEGVAPGKEEPTVADRSLGDMQVALGELLGLTFQKDGIDYTHPNLVHADMTMDQVKEALGGRSVSPFGQFMSEEQLAQMGPMLKMFASFGKAMMAGNPRMRDQLKLQLATQLSAAETGAMGQQMEQVILYDRNRVCFDVLASQLEKQTSGSIAIFYGAAHMPDMEKRLVEMGFARTSKRWMSAWQIGDGAEDAREAPGGATDAPAPARKPGPPADDRSRSF